MSQHYQTVYLASCDQRARAVDGTIMVAGEQFTAPGGYPALPWGMGPPSFITPAAPRWLVIDADDVEQVDGGVRIRSGRVLFDGPVRDAAEALDKLSAERRPHVADSIEVREWGVGAVGLMSRVKSSAHGTAAVGRHCKAELEEGSVLGAGENSRVNGADRCTVAGASNTVIDVGADAVIAMGSGGAARAGARSVIATASAARMCVGERGVAVGSFSSQFRGGPGALFVARDVAEDGTQLAVTAIVGESGVEPDTWYVAKAGSFQIAGDDRPGPDAGKKK